MGRRSVGHRQGSADLGCTGTGADSLPAMAEMAPGANAWSSLGYAMGPVTLFAEVHGNLVFNPEETDYTPFGGLLGIRLVFPVTARAIAIAAEGAPPPRAPPSQPPEEAAPEHEANPRAL